MTLQQQINRYLETCLALDYSEATVKGKRHALAFFVQWCRERSLADPTHINRQHLERYRRYLYYFRQANGRALSITTQRKRLTDVKTLLGWLTQASIIPFNPASELTLPKPHKRLPRGTLSQDEIDRLLQQARYSSQNGLRDRAILETFYATGIRRAELANLSQYDIDLDQQTLMIRLGKGNKDRLLPIGARACHWIDRYIEEERLDLMVPPDPGSLFLNNRGQPFTPHQLSDLTKHHMGRAGIDKPGACHLFRHTMATQMLENGADLRFIQAMLGHADISTTQIYTHVSLKKLRDVYTRTHPAKIGQSASERGRSDSDLKAELMSALVAEASEENQDGPCR